MSPRIFAPNSMETHGHFLGHMLTYFGFNLPLISTRTLEPHLPTPEELAMSVMTPTVAASRTRYQNRKLNLSFSHGRPVH